MSQITRVGDLSISHLPLMNTHLLISHCQDYCNWTGNLKRSGVDPARESRAEFTEKARPELSLGGGKNEFFI